MRVRPQRRLSTEELMLWIVVLEKTLESPCKEIRPVGPKGNQPQIFIGRTGAEAETPVLWQSDVKNWLLWKDPDAGKGWGQEEKGKTEDEMVGWHHQFNGDESEHALGDGEGQGHLTCFAPWGHKGSDTTERQNSNISLKPDDLLGLVLFFFFWV